MDGSGRDQVGSVLFIIVFEVRQVLEIVRVDFAVGQRNVGLHVVGEFLDDQRVAVFCERVLD